MTESATSNRLLSLDVFRGMTVAGMVLVNNPGSWAAIYWPLEHAPWNGWTPTDLIFPFFVFIVGVSIAFAFAKRIETSQSQRDLYFKIARRTLIIFGLGLLLAAIPYFPLSTLRIPGVLQRIAVCYFFASIIFLKTRWRSQVVIVISLCVVYWFLMTRINVPGYGVGDLGMEGNLAAFIDRKILGPHIWKAGRVYDPEGILSTIPAIATALIGVLTGSWLRTEKTRSEKVAGMFVGGAVCVAIGWAWNAWFPINKALWTSSYVFFTGGLALQFLALCYWLIDIQGYKRWAKPFEIFGVNALPLFFFSGLLAKAMIDRHWNFVRPAGTKGNLWSFIFDHGFATWLEPKNASLAFALCYILFWLFLMWLLYRKRIFIKV
jgi:predicted acyltransferase